MSQQERQGVPRWRQEFPAGIDLGQGSRTMHWGGNYTVISLTRRPGSSLRYPVLSIPLHNNDESALKK